MPKKSKFIDKANSKHYHLLHRSHTDAAYAEEGVPSEFVLVEANRPNKRESLPDNPSAAAASSSSSSSSSSVSQSLSQRLKSKKDHINAMGFKNDGYDYSQHLKEMGGGKYIGKNGSRGLAPVYTEVELPPEALPSGVEMPRDLEAITIDHDLMDTDLHAALFGEEDADGAFEELDDNFCAQVMEDDGANDFDFDAHIATLIAKSEQTTLGATHVQEREASRGQKNIKKGKKKVSIHVEGEDEDEDEEYEEFSDYEGDENSQAFAGESAAPVPKLSSEAMQKLEEQFENTLAEYEDDELGYIDCLDEEELAGSSALKDDDAVVERVMDEFLQQQKDSIPADGTGIVKKGNRRMLLPSRQPSAGGSWLPDGEVVDNATGDEPVDIQREKQQQVLAQQEAVMTLGDYGQTANAKHNPDIGIETAQQYLQEVREESQWDCESIISTYSTLDNHPHLIKTTNSKFKPYKSRHAHAQEKVNATESVATRILKAQSAGGDSVASGHFALSSLELLQGKKPNPEPRTAEPGTKLVNRKPVQIVLSGKMNIPVAFSSSESGVPTSTLGAARHKGSNKSSNKGSSCAPSVHMPKIQEEHDGVNAAGDTGAHEGEENDAQHINGDENGNIDTEDEDEGDAYSAREPSGTGRRKETAEEKRLRKQQVKVQRREKRVQKKGVKEAYRVEGSRLAKCSANEQSIDHVSVYHYANK